jgi:peptidyl-prolyl cis-trans isomerase B (cyclophilin B)
MINKYLLFGIACLVGVWLVGCGGSKPSSFRPYTASEQALLKSYKKVYAKKTDAYRVLIATDYGNMVVRLYDETPLHRANFIDKVNSGFYDSLLFHRVIKNFMIQGGDPGSKYAQAGTVLGNGSAPGQARIPAEIKTDLNLYHKKGVLAAARDGNPQKASSNCQFYLAQGRVFRPGELDSFARQRGFSLSGEQKQLYTTVGGIPHLDGAYTVFGELEEGIPVLDKLALVPTGPADRPKEDLRMRLFVISKPKH